METNESVNFPKLCGAVALKNVVPRIASENLESKTVKSLHVTNGRVQVNKCQL